MKWRDWLGYPGMIEDQNNAKMAEMVIRGMKATGELATVVATSITALNERIVAIENVLKQHKLAE